MYPKETLVNAYKDVFYMVYCLWVLWNNILMWIVPESKYAYKENSQIY